MRRVEYMKRRKAMQQHRSFLGRRRVQLLLTMGVLLLAVSVVVGSGASFTSQSANPGNIFTAGTLTHYNSIDTGFILKAEKMWPGESESGTVSIKNTGDGKGDFFLKMAALSDPITGTDGAKLSDTLQLQIVDSADTVIYKGALMDFPGAAAGSFAPDHAETYTFTVTFPDTDEGKGTAGSDNKYKLCSTQVDFEWEAISSN